MKNLILTAVVMFALCFIGQSASSQIQTFTVTNSSGTVITGVSLSPNDADSWGMNLNTAGNLQNDQTFQFSQAVEKANCIYDLRFTTEDGKYYTVQDVDLCKNSSLTLKKPEVDMKKDTPGDKKTEKK